MYFIIRFQQLQSFEENFGILWNFEKSKSIEQEKLRTFCDNHANITIMVIIQILMLMICMKTCVCCAEIFQKVQRVL